MGVGLLLAAALLLAFANGANDNFKGVATLEGSGTLAYRPALLWATISTLAGSLAAAWLSGGLVARFSGKGLLADGFAADPSFLLAVAGAACATVLLATWLGFPISTTHALTGALVGAGLVVAGPAEVAYGTLGLAIALPLVASPFAAMVLAGAVYTALHRTRLALDVTHEDCICVGQRVPLAAIAASGRVVPLGVGPRMSIERREQCERRYTGAVLGVRTQSVLNGLHVVTAGAVCFARGLNDAPKILALLIGAGAVGVHDGLGLVAVAMAAGGVLAAGRVAHTLAHGITAMSHGQGFAANLVTAVLVTLASPLGLPVSTTHVSCGALFGIGAVNGEARWRVIGQVLLAWVTTLPAAMLVAAFLAFLTSVIR
jgi:PiT family inorganic phosphate transporter